jgi:UDP-N-acetylmuramate-alanine ligase
MERGTYHLVGVAGVGMSALAQALCGLGHAVSGSDRYADQGQDLAVIRKLKAAGILFVPQDGSGVTAATTAIVVSTAIEADNPDIAAAARLGVPVRHRSEMLAELAEGHETVAITGTSGKTTVTGMVGWILEQLGADPTVVNGGALVNWADDTRVGNVRIGQSRLMVIEADESDRSCLRYSPDWAILTNQSADHFAMEETRALFEAFRGKVRQGSVAGWDAGMPWHNLNPELSAAGSRFQWRGVEFEIPLLGAHNAENALQAAVLCERMGHAPAAISRALRGFRGIQRRLERLGAGRGVTVIDEYAHNPAKIAAAWQAVAPYYGRVLAMWRPHGFKPLALMFDDLVKMFAGVCRPADRLWLLPVYYAGGTVQRQADSDKLVEALRAAGVSADWAPDYEALMAGMLREARERDVVLCIGARDPGIPEFGRRLVGRLSVERGGDEGSQV